MLIENIDALKSWLTNTLTPICDADPVALSKYVVALVKKDKSEAELNGLCMDQLDVFLQDKTKEFVVKLFDAIKNKEYLEAPPAPPASEPLQPSDAANKQEPVKPKTEEKDEIKEPIKEEPESNKRKRSPRSGSRSPVRGPIRSPLRVRDVRGRFDRDDRLPPRRRYDDRGPPPPPRRFDHDRDRFRPYPPGGRFDENYRRGPPPPPPPPHPQRMFNRSRSHSPVRPRTRSRTRSRSRSPHVRARSRSRSPRPRSRSHTPRSYSRSRSRSRTRSRSRGRSFTPDSRGSTPIQDREPIRTEPGYHNIRGDNKRGPGGNRSSRPRCRDFDEKGFCMRGDLCPFDHGLDPVVVEDVALPSVIIPPGGGPPRPMPPGPPPAMPGMPPRMIAPGAPPLRPGPPNSGVKPDVPIQPAPPRACRCKRPHLPTSTITMFIACPEPYQPEPYNPEAPMLARPPPPRPMGPGFVPMPPGARLPGPPQPLPPGTQPMGFGPPPMGPRRDLVSVPTLPPPGHPGVRPQDEDLRDRRQVIAAKAPFDQQRRKPGFDYNRLGYKRHVLNAVNATLEVRKIPRELNNISKLNEHFSKFGQITNLQVCYEGDPEGALVTFANHGQANNAYRSVEALFNNRFIKVFWHKDKDETTNGNSEDSKPAVKEKPTIPPPEKMQLNNTLKKEITQKPIEKTLVHASSSGILTKTVTNTTALKNKVAAVTANENALQRMNPAVAAKKKKEESIRAKLEIQKKKQELLEKQLQEQKALIEKLEKNKGMSAEDKAIIMKAIKTLADGIEKLKKDLLSPKTDHKTPRTRQEAQKEILDTELELITKPAGPETIALRQKVEELKKEAASLGLLSTRGRGRGTVRGAARGVFRGGRGRGRGGGMMTHARSLDNRPKQLKVIGFLAEEKDELTTHFAMFGQLQNTEIDPSNTSAIFTFTTRKEAEQALSAAGKFKEKELVITWYKPGSNRSVNTQSTNEEPAIAPTASVVERLNSTDALEAELAAATAGDEADLEPIDDVDEDLLLGDLGDEEEDDDEDEDRSWRR